MKPGSLALIAELDAMRPPIAGAADAHRYKEWHHFNIHDPSAVVHVILNLGLAGDPRDPRRGQATVVLLAYRPGRGWCGTADLYAVEQVVTEPNAVTLAIGANAIRYDGGRYLVTAALKDGSLAVRAELEPDAFPLPIRNRAAFGGGTNDWIIVPRLAAHGELQIDGQTVPLDKALAYHDHNRGYWRWQDDLGWDWGAVLEPGERADRYTIVFERVTDRRHRPIGEGALIIWRGERIWKGFLGHSLDVSYGPLRHDLVTSRVPPILNVLWGSPRAALPSLVQVVAREGNDWVRVRFAVEAGLQVMLPHEEDDGYTVIHELWGISEVRGEVKGRRLVFTAPGFGEWAES